MGRVLLFGVAVAVLASIVIVVGAAMSLDFQNVLVGVSSGAVLALVRQRSPVARAGAFLIGFTIALVFYGLRLALLPASVAGNVVAIAGMIMVFTVICALTKDRLALWAMLLGGLVFSASYDGFFIQTPWFALTQLPLVYSGVLVTVSAGFLVTLLVELREDRGGVDPVDPMAPSDAPVESVAVAPTADAGAGVDPGLQVLGGSDGGNR